MTNTIITSSDIIIRTGKTVDVIIREMDGKIDSLIISFNGFKQEVSDRFTAQQKQIDSLRNDIVVINERINSINDKLGSIQYSLSWGVSVITLLFAALPVIWAVRKVFSFSIRDAIRKAVREELAEREAHSQAESH